MSGSTRHRGERLVAPALCRDRSGHRPATVCVEIRARRETGAKRELDRLVAEVNSGRSVRTEATLSDLLIRWTESIEPNWLPSTRRRTESAIRVHPEPMLGSRKLSRLSAAFSIASMPIFGPSLDVATSHCRLERSAVCTGSSGRHCSRRCGGVDLLEPFRAPTQPLAYLLQRLDQHSTSTVGPKASRPPRIGFFLARAREPRHPVRLPRRHAIGLGTRRRIV